MINRIVKLIISIIYMISYELRSMMYHALGKRVPSTFVILTYHSIQRSQMNRFRRQLDRLRKYHPIFADEDICPGTGRHYVAVTFDDGYENLIDNAIPELEKRAIPAMIFIPTGSLGKTPGWITNPKNRNIDEPVMNDNQVRSIRSGLIKIGSHSVTHRDLTRLPEEEVMTELTDSRKYLEELLGEKVRSFAFPFGLYNDTVLSLSRRAGYNKVFCCWPAYPSYRTDGYLLGRVDTSPDDWDLEFQLKIMGAYQWQPIGIAVKRRLAALLGSKSSLGTACTEESAS